MTNPVNTSAKNNGNGTPVAKAETPIEKEKSTVQSQLLPKNKSRLKFLHNFK